MNALATLSAELDTRFTNASRDWQHRFTARAIEWAYAQTNVDEPSALEALAAFRTNQPISDQLRSAVAELAESADNKYFELKGDVDEDKPYTAETDWWFRKARALFAMREACDGSLNDAVYEASSAGPQDPLYALPELMADFESAATG
jgi:hypothetical protein